MSHELRTFRKINLLQKENDHLYKEGIWCYCGNPSGDVRSYQDGEGMINKHHYCCLDCGGVVQIG